MARRNNSGRILEVIEGDYKGMRAFMYHKDQTKELIEQGKVVVYVSRPGLFDSHDVDKIIILATKTKVIGFFD